MRKSSSPSPKTLFKIFATAEAITWAGLIAALIVRAVADLDLVRIAGGIHGFVFLSYCTVTVFVWVNQKWPTAVGVTGLLLSIIPFATVPFDIAIDRKGLLAGGWRLAPDGDKPQNFVEKTQAWVLRNPLVAVLLLAVLVTVLFLVLLFAGPPIPQS
ncbi:DUF3817 domain-containing protein [Canibacter zhoujuaniae]|uniref:DUF3817 domain-containing protein n=1 Tax=Canibacter zhoujuaniae TaxID=2708343 RepID=UPI0014207FD9|nr:DUF3817 domain-containing protein [Canibacter zhoujuaniae]